MFATTRNLIASNRELVLRVAKGFIKTIHAFKTQPETYIPVLQQFLNVDDRSLVEDQHRFYAPLFPQAPRMALSMEGLQSIRDTFCKTYAAAAEVEEADFADNSIIDELEHSGFIARVYAGE